MMQRRWAWILLFICLLVACDRTLTSPGKLLKEADKAFQEGSFSESERMYEQFLQSFQDAPQRWEAWNRLLFISRNIRRDHKRAIVLLDTMRLEYIEAPGRSYAIFIEMGTDYAAMKDRDKAVQMYERALQLEGLTLEMKREATWRLGMALKEAGKIETSRKVLTEGASLPLKLEDKAQFLYALGTLEVLEGNLNEAKKRFQKIVDLKLTGEAGILAIFSLAEVAQMQGDLRQAKELFSSIKNSHPNPAVVASRLEFLEKRLP